MSGTAQSYRDFVAQADKPRTDSNTASSHDKRKSPFDKVGLLTKLGGNVKNWLERGFALRSDYKLLHYFRSAKDFKLYASDPQKNASKIAGTINLVNARMFLATYISFENCLEISTSPPDLRHYYVYAKTAPELRSWINKLALAGVTFVAPSMQLCQEELKILPPLPAPQPVYGMQGTIEKRGTFNTAFKARFFRIDENSQGVHQLAYYNRYDDAKPKGAIALVGSRVVESIETANPEENPECQWGVETPQRLYVLRSRSRKEKRLWMEILRLFLRDLSSPALLLSPETESSMAMGSALSSPRSPDDERASPVSASPVPSDNKASGKHNGSAIDSDLEDSKPSSHHQDNDDEQQNYVNDGDMEEAAASASVEAFDALPPPPSANPDAARAVSGLGKGGAAMLEQIQKLEEQRIAREKLEHEKAQVLASEEKDNAASKDLIAVKALLTEGDTFLKFGRQGKPHKKFIFLAGSRLHWSDTDMHQECVEKSVDIQSMVQVFEGKETTIFKRDVAKEVDVSLCFSVEDAHRTLDLAADSKDVRNQWIRAIKAFKASLST